MSANALGRLYGDREVVVRAGDKADCMFSVQAGYLEIVRETAEARVQVGLLKEGDIFGEMAIFENEPRSETVRAVGPVRLLTIDKKTFLRRLHEDPSIAINVVRSLCARLRRLRAEIAKLKLAKRARPCGLAGYKAKAAS